ncbi:hypothetical protein D3C86_2244170 [compost metagenome]
MKKLGKILIMLTPVVAPVACAAEDDSLVTPAGPPASTGGTGGNGGELTGGVGNATPTPTPAP